ncbi:FecCD family ABC transporter permease [Alkalihalobacterium elongatum]|uniref:FecCD family ABC transporter permease n=1 Tax=Alkalihalobacterium elongatum TaxID=2675466 RepID=UPI001C2000B9|nr:iron ABC transporter permease [Alkalihalobacterium elongatum]
MKQNIMLRLKNNSISYLISKRGMTILLVSFFLLSFTVIVSLSLGEFKLTPYETILTLLGYGTDKQHLVIFNFRLPRIITAILAGSALAVSGAIIQGVGKNPLASPELIGITGGAAAGVIAFLITFSDPLSHTLTVSIHYLPFAAIIGGLLSGLIVYVLAWKNGVTSLRFILIGIGIATVMQALTTFLMKASPTIYHANEALTWITGSVYGSNWQKISTFSIWLIILFPIVLFYVRHLNVHYLGDEIATGLGSSVEKQRFVLLFLSVCLASVAVALAGAIGFVGLMAPHISRLLVGPSFGFLLPVTACVGAVLVVVADLIGRLAFAPLEIPAGVFTAAIGAPYFIYLLIKSQKN